MNFYKIFMFKKTHEIYNIFKRYGCLFNIIIHGVLFYAIIKKMEQKNK